MSAHARMLTNVATVCEVAAVLIVAAAFLLRGAGDREPLIFAGCAIAALGLACDLRAATLRD